MTRDDGAIQSFSVKDVALFLDLDGSIVPIASTPDAVKASTACRVVLRRALDHLRGRVAILSGRTITSVDEVLGGTVQCVAGVHGLQRRTPLGALHLEPPHARVADAAAVLEALAEARPGLLVELKGASVAIHYRSAPEAGDAVVEAVERLAKSSGLVVQLGDMVAELRTPGPDKGSALDRFMLEAPFAGTRPIYIGDDLTDEAAFAAARRHGGVGVIVGSDRATAAQGRLDHPAATLSWIMRSLDRGRFDLAHAGWAAAEAA
jgi:trehalose 6-phosphate phosphatase